MIMLALPMMIFGQSCSTVADSFCAAARPIMPNVEAIMAMDRQTLLQIVNHNDTGHRLCGWT